MQLPESQFLNRPDCIRPLIIMGKEKIIKIAAMIVILIGVGATAYVYATQTTTTILVQLFLQTVSFFSY